MKPVSTILVRKDPMGEARKDALKPDFDRRLKLEFRGTKVTSDAGYFFGKSPIKIQMANVM